MSIESSILTESDILNILNQQYGIEKILKIEKLLRGSSNIFKISIKNTKLILKEFNFDKKFENIKKEILVINFLKEKNFSVPTYVKTIEGDYYYIFKGKILIVQDYIEGYILENNSGDYVRMIQSAKVLGKIVRALKEYDGLQEEKIIRNVFSKHALMNSIKKMEKQCNEIMVKKNYKKILKDVQDKIKICKYLVENFDFKIINELSILGTHGDYNVQQLIYNNDNITVIDFETAKRLPIVWEIMRSYSYVDIKAKDGTIDINNMIDYFYEFNKYVKLNYYDLKYAPYVYLIQLAGSMFGYREYMKDNSKEDLLKFGLFRTKLCRFLYKNAEEIANRLLIGIKKRKMSEK